MVARGWRGVMTGAGVKAKVDSQIRCGRGTRLSAVIPESTDEQRSVDDS
jgi:hypothetical protein